MTEKQTEKKSTLKTILSKIPLFIFCVVFISLHNYLYGTENSVIGVTILVGIFISLKDSFGFCVKQATLSIPVLFLIVAISPKLASFNPFLGLIVNFISISIIIILTTHDLSMSSWLPFMLGYIFCQGYNVSSTHYRSRVISLVVGSVIIAILYFVINRKKTTKRTILDLFKEFNIHSTRSQWQIRLVVTLTLVMFVGDLLGYPRTFWVSLTVLSLTTPFVMDHSKRAKARVPAAILGTMVFVILFVWLIPEQYQTIVVMLGGFLSMFINNYFLKSIYNSFSALGSAIILFPVREALFLRIESNIIGTIVAILSYFTFTKIFEKIYIKQNNTILN